MTSSDSFLEATQPLDEVSVNIADNPLNVEVWGWLVNIKPSDRPTLFPITGVNYSVGRDPTCHLVIHQDMFNDCQGENLKYAKLSRVQFQLVKDGNIISLMDKSMNGTYIDEYLVGRSKSRSLTNGDVISVVKGDFEVFHYLEERNIQSSYPKEIYSKYLVGRRLGEGTTAVVREGYVRSSGKRVAMKFIMKDRWESEYGEPEDLMQEVNILRDLDHPCITKVLDCVETSNIFLIVMEFVGGGELEDQVWEEHEEEKFDEDKTKFQFYQLCHTIRYLHSKNVCHRDLKLENILLSDQGPDSLIKVSDFGLSKVWSARESLKTFAGTPVYMAPEILLLMEGTQTRSYTCKSDCWSLGVILYVMLSGHWPFKSHQSTQDLTKTVMSGKFRPMSGKCWELVSKSAQSLVKELLQTDPELRLSAHQVLQHPWLIGETVRRARLVMGMKENFREDSGIGSSKSNVGVVEGETGMRLEDASVLEKKRKASDESIGIVTRGKKREMAKGCCGETDITWDL